MSLASSPGSSLLQLHRPAQLAPQCSISSSSSTSSGCPKVTKSSSSRPKVRTAPLEMSSPACYTGMCDSPLSDESHIHDLASASHEIAYLNVPATTYGSNDHGEADWPSLAHAPRRQVTDSCSRLLSILSEGAVGEAMPKEQWQPDSSSALCTYPLCTTNFGPASNFSYFSLKPRRHHCRLCGRIFCHDHTKQRASLLNVDQQGKRAVSNERVCDLCVSRPDDEEDRIHDASRRGSSWSDQTSSTHSDFLVTPGPEDVPYMINSLVLPSCTSSISANIEAFTSSLDQSEELAPMESWMGPSGVLSLYPLAVKPSHSTTRTTPTPAAAPLFSPSISSRRCVRKREMERTSPWIPGRWGYRREDFDPSLRDEDDCQDGMEGGLVIDGPIRLRASARKLTSPALTRSSSPLLGEDRARMEAYRW